MDREQIISALGKMTGSKRVYLPEVYTGKIEIGEMRPVAALSKKYVYMDCQCYLKWMQVGDEYVQSVQRIPVCSRGWGEVSGKVALDNLSSKDLESLLNGFRAYLEWERDHNLPYLKKRLQESEECAKRLSKLEKYL
jgi:hypothetical protein